MTNQLWLNNWTVTASRTLDDRNEVEARYDVSATDCPKCGVIDASLYKHGAKLITYADAPILGLPTFIKVLRQRYRCRECLDTFMQPLPDMDDDRRMTNRCRAYVERQCLINPNTHVAEEVGLDEKVVRQIGQAQAERMFSDHRRKVRAPRVLGIDELGLGGVMRAIFVNIEGSWPIEILPTRWEKPVTDFLLTLEGRENVEIVTTDMWRPYKRAVSIAMPQAILVVDKWHVMRMANDSMEMARRVFQAGGMTKQMRVQLKRGRHLFLKRPYQLNRMQLMDLDGWLKNTPQLAGAYETKEAFMDIWRARTAGAAKLRLDDWRASIPPHLARLFKPVVTATLNWEAEILAYFITDRKWTNAATEARNRAVKSINRNGAGYSFDALRARALFGKRRGRLKREQLAGSVEPEQRFRSCAVCGGATRPIRPGEYQYAETYKDGYVFDYAMLCAACFYTDEAVPDDDDSTSQSE